MTYNQIQLATKILVIDLVFVLVVKESPILVAQASAPFVDCSTKFAQHHILQMTNHAGAWEQG